MAGPASSMHGPELGRGASSHTGPQPDPGLQAGTSRLPPSGANCPVGLCCHLETRSSSAARGAWRCLPFDSEVSVMALGQG